MGLLPNNNIINCPNIINIHLIHIIITITIFSIKICLNNSNIINHRTIKATQLTKIPIMAPNNNIYLNKILFRELTQSLMITRMTRGSLLRAYCIKMRHNNNSNSKDPHLISFKTNQTQLLLVLAKIPQVECSDPQWEVLLEQCHIRIIHRCRLQ